MYKYFVEYGLNERVTFDTIEQMNIFTAGLGFKGESFTCGNVKDVAKLNKNYSDTPKLLKNQK